MTAKKSNTLLIVAVAAVVAIAAYWFLVLTPKREQAAQLQDQIAAKQTELDAARQELAANRQAKVSYKANYASLARLGKAVPAAEDVESLLVQLDAASGDSEVAFDSFASSGEGTASTTTPGGFQESSFTLAFSGTYFTLSDLVDRVERFVSVSDRRIDVTGRLMVLKTLQLAPEGDFPRVRAQIGGSAYVLPNGEDVTAGATAAAPAGATDSATSAAATTTAASTTTTSTTTTTTDASVSEEIR